MGFANLSTWAVAGGLAALAAVLYALQRLRIRLRERQVATLLFWKAALDESPARTLVQRFRHVWAYLLILSICSLIWLAIAEPEWRDRRGDDFYVLLLDGSAGMAREGRFEQALEELERDLASLPPDRRQVLWSGARAETLLRPGEHALLLRQRLAGRTPEAVPSLLESQLAQLASIRRDFADGYRANDGSVSQTGEQNMVNNMAAVHRGGEGMAMNLFTSLIDMGRNIGDKEWETAFDFNHADEVMHVEVGNYWVPRLTEGDAAKRREAMEAQQAFEELVMALNTGDEVLPPEDFAL